MSIRDQAQVIGSKMFAVLRDESLDKAPGEGSLASERAAWVKNKRDGQSETAGWFSRRFAAVQKVEEGRITALALDDFGVCEKGIMEPDCFVWRNHLGNKTLNPDQKPRPWDRVFAHCLIEDRRGNKNHEVDNRDHRQHHVGDTSTMIVRRTDIDFEDEMYAPISSALRVVSTRVGTSSDPYQPFMRGMPKAAFNITFHGYNREKDAGYLVDMTPVGTEAHGSERWGQIAHLLKISALPGVDRLGPVNLDQRENKRVDFRTTAHFFGKDWTDSSDTVGYEHGPLYLTTDTAIAPTGGTWYYAHFIWEDPTTPSTNPAPKGPHGYSKVIRPVFMIPDPLEVDAINESTVAAGVTVEGVLLLDDDIYLDSGHYIYGNDGSAVAMQFDVANGYVEMTVGNFMSPMVYCNILTERNAGFGITADGVLLKDGGGTFTSDVVLQGDGKNIYFKEYSYGITFKPYMQFYGARGTLAAPTVSGDDDVLAQFDFYGYSTAASAFVPAARILVEIDGTPDSGGDTTDMPGRIRFLTTPEGTGVPVEVVRITQDAKVGINNNNPQEDLHVNGVIRTDDAFNHNGNAGIDSNWVVAVGDTVTIEGGIITGIVKAP